VETDKVLQETIRTEFADRTILTIAHRINTIMDSDRILLLSAGKVVEFDAPENVDDPAPLFPHLLIIVVSYYRTKILYSMASCGNQGYCRRLLVRHLGPQPHQVKGRARGGRNRGPSERMAQHPPLLIEQLRSSRLKFAGFTRRGGSKQVVEPGVVTRYFSFIYLIFIFGGINIVSDQCIEYSTRH